MYLFFCCCIVISDPSHHIMPILKEIGTKIDNKTLSKIISLTTKILDRFKKDSICTGRKGAVVCAAGKLNSVFFKPICDIACLLLYFLTSKYLYGKG